jgi:5-methylcytosine-specific restriction endonuclease McrA
LREEKLENCGHKCQLCSNKDGLQVHHNNYHNLGNEDIDKDLITLCRKCHSKYHINPRTNAQKRPRRKRNPRTGEWE